MIPPIYQLLIADSAVTALAGSRIYYAQGTQEKSQPYIVWSVPSAVPNNNLSELPDNDDQRIQIDVYALEEPQAAQLAVAVRNAVEAQYDILLGPWCPGVEPDTGLSRWSMDVQIFNQR